MREAIGELEPEEAELVRRHYGEGDSLSGIARELGHAPSWASRSLAVVHETIRTRLGSRELCRSKAATKTRSRHAAVDTLPREATEQLPAVDSLPLNATEQLPAVDTLPAEATDELPAVDSLPGEATNELPAVDSLPGEATEQLPAVDSLPGEATNELPAIDSGSDNATERSRESIRGLNPLPEGGSTVL